MSSHNHGSGDNGHAMVLELFFGVVLSPRFTALKCMTSESEKSRNPLLLSGAAVKAAPRFRRAGTAIFLSSDVVPILSRCCKLIVIEQFCFSATPRCGGVLKCQHQLSRILMSVSRNDESPIAIELTLPRQFKFLSSCAVAPSCVCPGLVGESKIKSRD